MNIAWLLLVPVLCAQTVYEGREIRVTLRESGGAYSGTLEFQGQSFPLTARGTAGAISGSFQANGNPFPFTAAIRGAEMRLHSGGSEYVLQTASVSALAATGRRHTHTLGYSVQLASGWSATENPEGIVLLPPGATFQEGRNDNPEIYIAMVKDGYTPAEETAFVRQVSAAFLQGGGAVSRNGVRESAVFGRRPGSIYRWDVRDPQAGRQIAFDLFGAPEGSRIFVFLSVGTASQVRTRETEVRQMLASMSYEAPRVQAGGPLADSTPLAQQWLQKLRGKLVRQFHAYSGMSSEKFHSINADGTYSFRSSSMVSVDVSGASALSTGRNATTGRWKIRDMGGRVFLQVTYTNGETNLMPITQDERNWYLNGEKAFAVNPE